MLQETVKVHNFDFVVENCCGIVEQNLIIAFPGKYNKVVCGQGALQFLREKVLGKQMSHPWLTLHILFKV